VGEDTKISILLILSGVSSRNTFTTAVVTVSVARARFFLAAAQVNGKRQTANSER
jgi:hypothetical protein